MRVISWNLLRLEGAAVDDVAALLERERPDVLLMQEVTQHMDVLLQKIPGHYHRLPWPGRIHGLAVWSRHNFATPHILPLPASGLPGRLPNLLARFQNHTLRIWERHGIRQAGFWTTLAGESNYELTYLLAWESLAEREAKWPAFGADPEWLAARAESEKDGQIVANISNQFLTPTAFSSVK